MTDTIGSGGSARPKPAFAEWSRTFLEELANSSNVQSSARKAGVSPSEVYRQRRTNPDFAGAWRLALCEGYDNLEMSMLYRLRTGELKPAGGVKKAVRTWDLATALRLLSAHRETVATERATRDDENPDDVLKSLNDKLGSMRKQALAAGKDVWAVPGDKD